MCLATVLHTSLGLFQEFCVRCSEDAVGVALQEAVSTGPKAVADYTSQVLAVMCEAAEHQGGVTTLGNCLCCCSARVVAP